MFLMRRRGDAGVLCDGDGAALCHAREAAQLEGRARPRAPVCVLLRVQRQGCACLLRLCAWAIGCGRLFVLQCLLLFVAPHGVAAESMHMMLLRTPLIGHVLSRGALSSNLIIRSTS